MLKMSVTARHIALAAFVAASVSSCSVSPSPQQSGTPTAGLDLAGLKRATVLITRDPLDPLAGGWGSGSIVSTDGLILTNAHVAANEAPGLGVLLKSPLGSSLGEPTPKTMYIYTVDGDEPATPTYRADLVLADGYLDLAVLRITALADGTPVDPSTLHLTPVPLGSVDDLVTGVDNIRVFGFPGNADTFRIHFDQGDFENLADDAIAGPKAWINTNNRIQHGNSGGLAADRFGRLIGIPDQTKPETGGTGIEYLLRSVDLAKPLIAAAEAGQSYDPYTLVTKATGTEKAAVAGWAPEGDSAGCVDKPAAAPIAGPRLLRPQVQFDGMTAGDHVIAYLLRGRGDTTQRIDPPIAFRWPKESTQTSGCLLFSWAFDAQHHAFPADSYALLLLVGPNYETKIPITGSEVALGNGETAGAQSPAPDSTSPPATPLPGGWTVRDCPGISVDKWASGSPDGGLLGLNLPTLAMPGDVRDAVKLQIWPGLIPGGTTTLAAADKVARDAAMLWDVSDHWVTVLVGDRYYAFATSQWNPLINNDAGTGYRTNPTGPPCTIPAAEYRLVGLHMFGYDNANARSLRYDWNADGQAVVTDADTGAVIGGGLAPGGTSDVPTTPGPEADQYLLGRITSRNGLVNCAVDRPTDFPHEIAVVSCNKTNSYDAIAFFLLDSGASLDAYIAGRRSLGEGAATDVCGPGWHFGTDPANTVRGDLACSRNSDARLGAVAQIEWTEKGYNIYAFVYKVGGGTALETLWATWIKGGFVDAPR